MLTTMWIGGIEVVSLWDGAEDLNDHDILDPRYGPSDPVWDPYRSLYPAVFAAHGGWRLHVRATMLRANDHTILVDTGVMVESDAFMSELESLIDPGDLRWIWLTHTDFDHIGCLHRLLEMNEHISLAPKGIVFADGSDDLPVREIA